MFVILVFDLVVVVEEIVLFLEILVDDFIVVLVDVWIDFLIGFLLKKIKIIVLNIIIIDKILVIVYFKRLFFLFVIYLCKYLLDFYWFNLII